MATPRALLLPWLLAKDAFNRNGDIGAGGCRQQGADDRLCHHYWAAARLFDIVRLYRADFCAAGSGPRLLACIARWWSRGRPEQVPSPALSGEGWGGGRRRRASCFLRSSSRPLRPFEPPKTFKIYAWPPLAMFGQLLAMLRHKMHKFGLFIKILNI